MASFYNRHKNETFCLSLSFFHLENAFFNFENSEVLLYLFFHLSLIIHSCPGRMRRRGKQIIVPHPVAQPLRRVAVRLGLGCGVGRRGLSAVPVEAAAAAQGRRLSRALLRLGQLILGELLLPDVAGGRAVAGLAEHTGTSELADLEENGDKY